LLALVGVSVLQVYSYQEYSALAAASRQVEMEAKAEADRLNADLKALDARMRSGNASQKLSEVELLNQLLLRRSFSWTGLFSNLERIIPENVRLLGLHPFIDEQGRIGLNMNIRGKSLADATEFLGTLEKSGTFTDVVLAVEEKKDALPMGEVEFTLSTYYSPAKGTK
jgi:predicted translin family RNA/ssDNA-binding protein